MDALRTRRQVAGARPGRWGHIKVELLRATVLRARGPPRRRRRPDPSGRPPARLRGDGSPSAVTGVAALAEVRVLKGMTESARSLLAESGLDRDPLPWRRDSAYALAARAAVHASDDPARALEDLLAAGRLLEEAGCGTGGAALALPRRSAPVGAGETRGSCRTRRRRSADARRWGTPESIGTALHALALTENGERRIDLLTDAAGLLARSPDRLHRAFVQAELGAGLAGLGRGEAACAALLSACRLARACGAEPLARHVQGVWESLRGTDRGPLELSGTAMSTAAPDPASVREPSVSPAYAVHASPQPDAQPRQPGPQPPQPASPLLDRLTPQERKILHLAKEGHSNRDIAGRLFVAVRTVEFHLSGAYRKLGITGRRQLAQVFSGG
ncbi:LuxR C-terminal-related transcriptional regulator [Streptomyces lydicus]|nr:LuxR C-terminal-related transcriptional regulator [Streptomyces lydicus]